MARTIEELQTELVDDLTIELKNDDSFDADILAVKVKNAIRRVQTRRNYGVTSYTDEQIAEDLYKFYSTIHDLAIYYYNQIGVEGQTSHSENETDRTWRDEDSIIGDVYSFVQVLK